MEQIDVITTISQKMRLIRTEMDYTQDRMAEILGLSKKTLVEIEKGRKDAGWTVVVAVCALFPESEIIQSILGDDPLSILQMLSRQRIDKPKYKTFGGRVWWNIVEEQGAYRLQQNILSGHYRIIDKDNYLWYCSCDQDEALKRLVELAK
ncbi:MAG: helix-turn-helix transcriptional regulator [Acidobacteriota bacterium]